MWYKGKKLLTPERRGAMKSIGADLHSRNITFTAVNSQGKILNTKVIATSEKLVIDYLKEVDGSKQLTFEDGPLAEWMLNITNDKVEKVVICNPRENAKIFKGNSNDRTDSRNLAELLRLGALCEVKRPLSKERQEFREIVNLYSKLNKDITRAKNRLKAAFRSKGIACTGQGVYNEKSRDEWVKKIEKNNVTEKVAYVHWGQIDFLRSQKELVYKDIKGQAKKFKEIQEFLKVPGVGLVTAATFSAFIFNPWRFESKAKLWAYCGLSLKENDSGQEIDPEREKKRREKIIRRLTNNGNRRIKSALKSSAQVACRTCKDNELKRKYLNLRARGLNDSSAILSISRMLACKLWGIWKRVEREKNEKHKVSFVQ